MDVIYEKVGPVARVRLNRPAVLNAMNANMHEQLASIWDDFEADEALRVAVISGEGKRAFSVGQDLKETASKVASGEWTSSSIGSRGRPGWPRLTERFDLTKPIIAQVHGFALGGGFELALACDIIIASESAIFGLPEARLGLIPGAGGLFRLTRQMPTKTAMGFLLTGNRIPVDTALRYGLVNEVAPDGELEATVGRWIDAILSCSPLSIRAIKEATASSAHRSLQEAFSTRYFWEEQRVRSADAIEGPAAFAEGRTPVWKGR
ncbi:enoyl-CoA-hydratase DpgD [Sphingomonas sanguinis]|uniref:enoyl-CoA-hydratase DpgD n=1 Tax=Sphingomonas sanguinis TaxID=33051 RepID=UPI0009EDD4FC|nr:enoyl-CoA-hydratase DpgD [Sphingomonas sanguinis]